jgi:hypothetical protein
VSKPDIVRELPNGWRPAASSLHQVAEAVLSRYPSAPALETERAIAMLALWALETIEAGRLSPQDADQVFTLLDVEIDETADGPELSNDANQLLLEGMLLHDWGTEFSADPERMRALAFAILRASA